MLELKDICYTLPDGKEILKHIDLTVRDNSKQVFRSYMRGDTECYGHSECDGIIMDNGVVSAIPEIIANDVDARLIHEAAIGKIAGEQLIKLMTLGLTEKQAEEQIINGFLK